ncbi:MAG: hypothetical protein KOO66_10460 [Bacteroidales bacterium]|nr:hypothetical protein [Bacteroidales bacterium]
MRHIFLLFFLFTFFASFSNNAKAPRKENLDSIVSLLRAKLEIEKTDKEKLDSFNIELKNQLIIYKAKEDYFAAALGDQSNRFALIVTGLLAFMALLSFSWYKVEKMKINNKFNSFREEFNEMKNEYKCMESDLNSNNANSCVLIAQTLLEDNDFVGAFQYRIKAVWGGCKSQSLLDNKDYSFVPEVSNLKNAIEHLDEIKKDVNLKEKLSKNRAAINEYIETIQKTKNEDIKDLCAEIRISMKNYLK